MIAVAQLRRDSATPDPQPLKLTVREVEIELFETGKQAMLEYIEDQDHEPAFTLVSDRCSVDLRPINENRVTSCRYECTSLHVLNNIVIIETQCIGESQHKIVVLGEATTTFRR